MKSVQTILHVIDTTGPGGAETIFTQLTLEAKVRGYKSIALIRGPGWVQNELKKMEIETYVYDCKGSFNIKFLLKFIELIRKKKVDLIQAHLLGSSVYASLAGLIARVPVISTFHGFVDISEKERFTAIKFLSVRFGSQKVVAVTEQLHERITSLKYLKKQNVIVIANGVDTNTFPKKSSSINIDVAQIGCLGNVRKAKNYPLAIEVLNLLVNSHGKEVHLHIAGDDKNALASECKDIAESLHLTSHITWHGFIDSVPAYLTSLDVYLLTSSSEGHPLALTQAMSIGLPIVTTRCGVEHVVTEGKSALIAENGNAKDIADKVCLLLNNAELRVGLSSKAAEEARTKWSLKATFDKYFLLYGLK